MSFCCCACDSGLYLPGARKNSLEFSLLAWGDPLERADLEFSLRAPDPLNRGRGETRVSEKTEFEYLFYTRSFSCAASAEKTFRARAQGL